MDKGIGMFFARLVLGGFVIALIISLGLMSSMQTISDEQSVGSVRQRVLMPEEDNERLLYDDVFMDEMIRTYTLRSLTESLSRLGYAKGINCHDRAHELGRRGYKILGGESFKNCGVECHSGCRHGATEAFFAEYGISDLVGSINILCGNQKDKFGFHQCVHGIGHGLMAWFDYALYDALGACDLIDQQFHQDSCYSGVFMENIGGSIVRGEKKQGEQGEGGGVGHFTKFLNDDPHYPCNAVDDRYKTMCYWLQTDRILQLYSDLDRIGVECAKAPNQYQFSCFYSMGRTVSGALSLDTESSFDVCKKIPNETNRNNCMNGALSNLFWDETQADRAVLFCEISLGSSFEAGCYQDLIIRASEVVFGDFVGKFCGKVPEKYQAQCATQKMPVAEPLSVRRDGVLNVDTPKTNNATIRYVDGAYIPDTVHISVGQRVVWINNDEKQLFWPASNIHPTHRAYPGSDIEKCGGLEENTIFDACRGLQSGARYTFIFNTPGSWRFHDHINPRAVGTVIVSE